MPAGSVEASAGSGGDVSTKMMTARSSERSQITGWLKDPLYDLCFIFGIALLGSVMSGVTVIWPALFLTMLTAHTWLFGYDHLVATYTNLLGTPQDRLHNWRLIVLLPPLVFGCLYGIGRRYGLTGMYTMYFFGQFFHTVRQSWGIAQQYRHRAGGIPSDPMWLSEVTLWSVPLWGFLHRCTQQPEEFLYQQLWLPTVPVEVTVCGCLLSVGLWLYFGYTRLVAYRRGQLAIGHTLYMLSHLGIYLGGYILIEDISSGWLLVNVWHNVQYLMFVWLFNRRRFAGGIDPSSRSLSWLSQPGFRRAALYYLTCLFIATPAYYLVLRLGERIDGFYAQTVIPSAVLLSLSFTVHHYIVDGFIWKRRKHPAVL